MKKTMTLFEYVQDMSRRNQLAEDAGYNPDYIWQVATKRRPGSPLFAKAIEKHTHRRVLKSSIRPDIWDEEAA